MKSWLAILLWALCLPAQITPSPQAPPKQQSPSQGATPQDENARRAKVLLDRMVQALGGQAYLNIQDVSQEGRTYGFYHGQPTGAGAPFWRFWKYPDKDRLELTKQRDWWIIHNGDKGFEVTFRGVSL